MPTSARKLNFMIRNEIARDLEALVPDPLDEFRAIL